MDDFTMCSASRFSYIVNVIILLAPHQPRCVQIAGNTCLNDSV